MAVKIAELIRAGAGCARTFVCHHVQIGFAVFAIRRMELQPRGLELTPQPCGRTRTLN
jgi:hypothetical protein